MATAKVTFTLDELALNRLDDASARLSMPKSQVVREAILKFHEQFDRMSEAERLHKLRMFDLYVPQIPSRPQEEADREIAEIRRARKSGGRLHRS